MSLSLEEVKQYVRVDSSDDDSLLESLMATSKKLCMHVLRVDDEWSTLLFSEEVKTARLYTIAYLYEHREDANHNELLLTLRSLLFGLRKAEF
ncbi:head-tail connector protein [Streptococcus suis]